MVRALGRGAVVKRKPTVLVVDDNHADREMIARMLVPKFDVLEAPGVAAGLELSRSSRPDCVLLDHYMPGISGLQGIGPFVDCGAIVIMMTGDGSDELAAEAFKRGARDYVSKTAMTGVVLSRMIRRELERRRLETELSRTRAHFDEVAARISEVLWVRSLDGEFLYLSPAFDEVWGVPLAEMTRATWEASVHPEDRPAKTAAWERMASGQEYEVTFRIVRPDGETRRIHNRGYPIMENGKCVRVGGIARDVTEEMRLQQELRLAQKLEAIGQLAAGIAHEINTPSQYVSDNITFLSEGFAELRPVLTALAELRSGAARHDAEHLSNLAAEADLDYFLKEVPDAIEQAAAGIAQIKKIVLAMKEFSHPANDMMAIDFNHAVANTVTVARNEWKYVADVDLDLASDLPEVQCFPSEINQVVLNLVVNAAHAIADSGADRGTITVRTRRDGDHVLLTVADTGCGIPESIRDRIFDPFFTTKAVGKGTGQGLAIAHRVVVEHHRGTIALDSEVGRGTTFKIRLPIECRAAAEDEPARQATG